MCVNIRVQWTYWALESIRSISIVYCYIFSISFSQEEPIHDFCHLLRIRFLKHIIVYISICIAITRSMLLHNTTLVVESSLIIKIIYAFMNMINLKGYYGALSHN